jgi:ribosomal protein L24
MEVSGGKKHVIHEKAENRTPPDDYKQVTKEIYNEEGKLPAAFRPWESDRSRQSVDRMYDYHRALLQSKFFRKGHKSVPPIPEENWTIFQGDMVEVLVGKDKGKQGHVSRIIREENAVFVEGLHQKLIETIGRDQAEKYDVDAIITPVEQPLFVHEGQVMLVDPNDGFVLLFFLLNLWMKQAIPNPSNSSGRHAQPSGS